MLAENFQLAMHFVEGVLREFDQSEHHKYEEEALERPYVVSQDVDHDRDVVVKLTQKKGYSTSDTDRAFLRLRELAHQLADLEVLKMRFTATSGHTPNKLKQFSLYISTR